MIWLISMIPVFLLGSLFQDKIMLGLPPRIRRLIVISCAIVFVSIFVLHSAPTWLLVGVFAVTAYGILKSFDLMPAENREKIE